MPPVVIAANLPQPLRGADHEDDPSSSFLLFSPSSQPTPRAVGTVGGPEQEVWLEVDWNPVRIRRELTQATSILSMRGMKLSAQWTAEQLVGISRNNTMTTSLDMVVEEEEEENDHETTTFLLSPTWQPNDMPTWSPQEWYAKTLMDVGDYFHAASMLSTTTRREGSSPFAAGSRLPGRPLATLSPFGLFVWAYSLYMAGERRKEEDHLELSSSSPSSSSKGDASSSSSPPTQRTCRNPYLEHLMEILEEIMYETEQPSNVDAFGLYVYGVVLKEGQAAGLSCPRPAFGVLVESILQFPYHWSAWLDLAEVLGNTAASGAASSSSDIEPHVEHLLQPLHGHYMYHFFCAHLTSQYHQAHEDALVLYERLYEPPTAATAESTNGEAAPTTTVLFDSASLKSQLGVVHYHLRDFEAALSWFEASIRQDPYCLEHKDMYSNILYVRQDKVALSQLAHDAMFIDKYRPETCCIIGNYYSLKEKRAKAIQYFQRALLLDRTYTSAWTLMGHEYVELKQTESAMEAYRRAVAIHPSDYRAWYGLGQTYEFLNMPLYALFYYKRAVRLRPYDARMWCALGTSLVALHKIPDAIKAYEKAVAQDDPEGIATQKLATLYRQEGRTEAAAQCYLRHLELRYMVTTNNSAAASDATTTTPPPTLDDLVQGIVVEAPEAEALLFLAHYHATHQQYDTAALLASRLVEYPGPEKEQAKGLLRDLKSRSAATTTTSSEDPATATTTSRFEFSP